MLSLSSAKLSLCFFHNFPYKAPLVIRHQIARLLQIKKEASSSRSLHSPSPQHLAMQVVLENYSLVPDKRHDGA